MYIQSTVRYYRGSDQCLKRAPFLILLQPFHYETGTPMYAIVRKVAMQQLGPWMMGKANVGGKWISLSGSYGNDGLPKTVQTLPKDAIKVPDYLHDLWKHGGGWNGCGSEAIEMQKWAKSTFNV